MLKDDAKIFWYLVFWYFDILVFWYFGILKDGNKIFWYFPERSRQDELFHNASKILFLKEKFVRMFLGNFYFSSKNYYTSKI